MFHSFCNRAFSLSSIELGHRVGWAAAGKFRLSLPFLMEILLYGFFIELWCYPLFNYQCTLRTLTNTSAKSVAIVFTYQPSLAVDNLQGSLCTGQRAQTAAVAFLFIYLDNLSLSRCCCFGHFPSLPLSISFCFFD